MTATPEPRASGDPREGLESFLGFRQQLIEGGWIPGADQKLAAELTTAVVSLAGEPPAGTAVVATGGFGQGSLAIRSDVDLLILHRGDPDPEFVSRLLRPLWDAGLRVGHATRTPRDARRFAGSRLDALCSALTARHLVGDPGVSAQLVDQMRRLLEKDAGRIIDALAAEERRRRIDHPYRPMAMHLKTGRGMQRTLDMLEWLRSVGDAAGMDPPPPESEERHCRELVMGVRSALHTATGRPHETYDFELREPVARWMDTTVSELGRRLLQTVQTAERLATEACPALNQASSETIHAEPADPSFVRLKKAIVRQEPIPKIEAEDGDWETGDRSFFLAVLEPETMAVVWSLINSGWMAVRLPELAELVPVPHVVPFHRFAVFDHSVATVSQARRLLKPDPADALVSEVASQLSDPDLLLWAALGHDLGKAHEGDHSVTGAALIRRLCARVGLERHADLLARLVSHHLLLVDVATRFDLDDSFVMSRAADRIIDLETLRLLFLVTVADSRATGSDTWSPWRADLVQRAYRRLERELHRRSIPEPAQMALLAEQVVEAGEGGVTRSEVLSHLAGLTAGYRSSHTPEVIAQHIRVARLPLGPGGVRMDAFHGGASTRIVVTATDRPGLLTTLSGVLALERLQILDARFATRSDGRALDTFEVVDAVAGSAIDDRRIRSVESQLRRVMRGGFDLEARLAEKRNAYQPRERAGIDPVITITPSPGGGGVIEVEAADRLGLLHDIGSVLGRFGVTVKRARIDTRAGVAYDVFHVERIPAETSALEEALRQML